MPVRFGGTDLLLSLRVNGLEKRLRQVQEQQTTLQKQFALLQQQNQTALQQQFALQQQDPFGFPVAGFSAQPARIEYYS